MWPPSQPADVPERQVFQTFVDRRKRRTRSRLIMLALLVVIVGGGWLARPHFPGVEAQVRHRLGSVFRSGH